MRTTVTVIMSVLLASVALVAPAAAQQAPTDVSRVTYHATGVEGHPATGSGSVVDIALAPTDGAIEVHRIRGARPGTDYQIVASIFFVTACDRADTPFVVAEGELVTNGAGEGHRTVRFPNGALADAPPTFFVQWALVHDGQVAYRTGCAQVDLG